MAIQIECDACGQPYLADDDKAGRMFRCRKCQHITRIPAAEDEFEDWDFVADFPDDEEFSDEGPIGPPVVGKGASGSRKKKRARPSEGGVLGINWYLAAWKNFNNISGRARRKEYWMFVAGTLLIVYTLTFLEAFTVGYLLDDGPLFATVFLLVSLVPNFSVGIRRLHDIGRSGWWLLLNGVCLIGPIVLLVFSLLDSEPRTNRWGPNPKR